MRLRHNLIGWLLSKLLRGSISEWRLIKALFCWSYVIAKVFLVVRYSDVWGYVHCRSVHHGRIYFSLCILILRLFLRGHWWLQWSSELLRLAWYHGLFFANLFLLDILRLLLLLLQLLLVRRRSNGLNVVRRQLCSCRRWRRRRFLCSVRWCSWRVRILINRGEAIEFYIINKFDFTYI